MSWRDLINDENILNRVKELMLEGKGRVTIERELDISKNAAQSLMAYVKENDPELALHYELMRSKQRLQDKNRVLNKLIRSEIRFSNAIEELLGSLKELIPVYKFNDRKSFKRFPKSSKKVGIVQLSDLHLNELIDLVDTCFYNSSNYDIASARLYKYASFVIDLFSSQNIQDIIIANTGDTLNSDRRLDEIVTNAANRSKAMLIASDILSQFINHLGKHFNVGYLTVCGNESRKYDDLTWNSNTFTNNYDFDIHFILESRLPSVYFYPINSSFEVLVDVLGQKILFIHGQQLKVKDVEHSIEKIFAKYAKAGQIINFVIAGHVHSTYNSDFFARSSSLVGDNSYSNNCLLLKGKSSQNCYIVTPNSINTITVDLQNYDLNYKYDFDRRFVEGSMQTKSKTKAALAVEQFKVIRL